MTPGSCSFYIYLFSHCIGLLIWVQYNQKVKQLGHEGQNSWPTATETYYPVVVSPLFPRKTIPQTQSDIGTKGTSPGVHAQLFPLLA